MKENIGKSLKALRLLHKLTQKQISEVLNIPTSTYINWEKGLREPNIFNLKRISLYYKVSLNDLLANNSDFSQNTIHPKNLNDYLIPNLSEELIRNNLKENLKFLRVFKGKTRKEIASDLSVAPSGYTNWEYGYRQPDFTTLKKISVYHDIDVHTLVSSKLTEYDLLKITGESKDELISRFSRDLYERYSKIPDEYKPDVKKQLCQHVNPTKKQGFDD